MCAAGGPGSGPQHGHQQAGGIQQIANSHERKKPGLGAKSIRICHVFGHRIQIVISKVLVSGSVSVIIKNKIRFAFKYCQCLQENRDKDTILASRSVWFRILSWHYSCFLQGNKSERHAEESGAGTVVRAGRPQGLLGGLHEEGNHKERDGDGWRE